MINIVLCDDNKCDLDIIKSLLDEINLDFNIKEYTDPKELIKDLDDNQMFDAFLLDIIMNDINGVDVARHIRKTHESSPIFFITATPEYALKGYEVNAMRYYLKPLNKDQLKDDLYGLLKILDNKKNSYITISNTKGLFKIKISDIYYIESMLRTINIYTKDDTFSTIGKISDFESSLKNNNFIRVHKSFVVNLAYIKNIYKDTITLDNDAEILLSKHRSKEVHARLLKYVKENT